MSPLNEFVCNLTTKKMVEIYRDFVEFERLGRTGDTALRIETRRHLLEQGIPEDSIVVWMKMLTFEICREFAKEHMRNNGLDNS